MKTLFKITILSLLSALLLSGCQKKQLPGLYDTVYPLIVDRDAIRDVAANAPGDEVVIVKTDAPYWIVTTTADWITPDVTHGVGNGKSTILTIQISSNYKSESSTTLPRSGEVKISGGRNSVIIAVNQLGHEAVIDPSSSIGGIPDLDEFKDFVNAVNDGEDLTRWTNESGEIELLADLSLEGFGDWVPIGNTDKTGNGNTASSPTGVYFSGVFNGGGHSISGFKADATLAENKTWGLFGYVLNGTIKNLNLTDVDITLSSTGIADAGILVGTLKNSIIENVSISGKLDIKGVNADSKRFAVGGIAGFAISEAKEGENETSVKNCTVTLTVTADSGANTQNNVNCCHYGGIVGFATNANKDASFVHIESCTNNGTITARLGRSAGIVAAANYNVDINKCVNNANHTSSMNNGRIANISCMIAGKSCLTDCVNNGSLTTTVTNCQSGGFVSLLNDDNCAIRGGGNYGDIISAFATDSNGRDFRGLLVANFSKFAEVSGVVVSGRVGKYKAEGEPEWIEVTAENYIDGKYIGYWADDKAKAKIKNLSYVAP